MELTQNAKTVLQRRYLAKDVDGNLTEDIDGMFRRVADAIAAGDLRYDEHADVQALSDQFYELMTDLAFMPNSPTNVPMSVIQNTWVPFFRNRA